MPDFHLETLLPTDARRWVRERFSAAFLALQGRMQSLDIQFLNTWQQGETIFLQFVTRADTGKWVPKGLAKQMPGGKDGMDFIRVFEIGPEVARGPPFIIRSTCEIPSLGKGPHVRSTITIEEVGPRTTRQKEEGEIKVKLFGFGKVVEKILAKSLTETNDEQPKVVETWERYRAEAAAKPEGLHRLLSGHPGDAVTATPEVRSRLEAPLKNQKKKQQQTQPIQPAPPQTEKAPPESKEQPLAGSKLPQEAPTTPKIIEESEMLTEGEDTQPPAVRGGPLPSTTEQAQPPMVTQQEEDITGQTPFAAEAQKAAFAGLKLCVPEWSEHWRSLGIPKCPDRTYTKQLQRVVRVGRVMGLIERPPVTVQTVSEIEEDDQGKDGNGVGLAKVIQRFCGGAS